MLDIPDVESLEANPMGIELVTSVLNNANQVCRKRALKIITQSEWSQPGQPRHKQQSRL